MLQRMFGWFGHHARCLWILDGLRFWRDCRTIDAEGARARITCRDRIECRDVLEALGFLRGLIEHGRLLRKFFHPFGGERLAWARRGDGNRIAVDGAIVRVGRGGREGPGRGGARDGSVDRDGICDGRSGREGSLRARAEERGG